MQEMEVPSLRREDPLKEGWQPTPLFSPGESHGQKSLVAYSPGVAKESDTTERLANKVYLGPVYFGDNTKKN